MKQPFNVLKASTMDESQSSAVFFFSKEPMSISAVSDIFNSALDFLQEITNNY